MGAVRRPGFRANTKPAIDIAVDQARHRHHSHPARSEAESQDPSQAKRPTRQKWMPRIICCIATASADSLGLPLLSPAAAAESGNMRNVVLLTICATRGTNA